MRILILNWRDPYHPLAGGAELSMLEHAKYWRKKGADVTWFASSFKGALEKDSIDGIKIKRHGSHFTVHIHAFIYFLKKGFKDVDVVVDCFHFIPYFTPVYLKDKKIIAWINEPAKNAWFKNIFFPLNIIGYLIEPLFFRLYKKITFVTSAESIKLELKRLGVGSIDIIPHGIKIIMPKTVKREKDPTLIYLAQIAPDKGIEDGIEAFKEVLSKVKNAKLWIVGKPSSEEYLKYIKKIVKDKKLTGKIEFYGFVSEAKKFELLKKAWILIHPSIREGWGLNIIEANGVGTPSVGYDVTGLRDSIRNNRTGLLSAPNSHSMAEKCLVLMKNKALYAKLEGNAKAYSTQFSWAKSGEKSWKLINE